MTSPPKRESTYGYVNCDCPKRRYDTKAQAREVAARRRAATGEHLQAYKCPIARGVWHIGHPKATITGDRVSNEMKRRTYPWRDVG